MDVLAPIHQERRTLREALGRVGVWSFTLETQSAEAERSAAAEVSDVATRYGVDRRTIHRWLAR